MAAPELTEEVANEVEPEIMVVLVTTVIREEVVRGVWVVFITGMEVVEITGIEVVEITGLVVVLVVVVVVVVETVGIVELVVETTIGHVENKVEIAEEDKTVTSASDVTNAVSVTLAPVTKASVVPTMPKAFVVVKVCVTTAVGF